MSLAVVLNCPTLADIAQPVVFSESDAAIITRSMDGEWAGVLEYANYSDGRRVEIPMAVEQEASAIAPVVLRHVTFTDPGKIIESGEIVAIDAQSRTLSIRSMSGGDDEGDGELWAVEAAEIADPDDWSLVLERDGRDDNRPARLRLTQRMLDGKLSSRKEVDYTDDDGEAFVFRNEFRLERRPADPQTLVGDWTIDLRSMPDAEPSPATLSITSVDAEAGTFEGTFYNGMSELTETRFNTDWQGIRFAFITSDGQSRYHTQGTLRGGSLAGTTHAVERGFLAVWTGVGRE
ncbi:MAG: hypothetical protein AAGH71_01340 [Planctomycetota bacterium]